MCSHVVINIDAIILNSLHMSVQTVDSPKCPCFHFVLVLGMSVTYWCTNQFYGYTILLVCTLVVVLLMSSRVSVIQTLFECIEPFFFSPLYLRVLQHPHVKASATTE